MLIPPPDRLGKTTDPGDGYAASAQSMGAALNATVRHRHLCCPQSPSIRKVTSWAKLEIGISKTASAACRRYSVHCPDQEPIRHRRTRRFRVAQTLQVERVPLQPAVLCHWPRLWASGDARPARRAARALRRSCVLARLSSSTRTGRMTRDLSSGKPDHRHEM
jgi:hypothetical protein